MLLLLRWYALLFVLVGRTLANTQGEAFMEVTLLFYEDVCIRLSMTEWDFYTNATNETLSKWEEERINYDDFEKQQIEALVNADNETLVFPLKYKRDLVEKPGDTLLESDKWENLVRFGGQIELSKANSTRPGIEKILSHSGSPEEKLKTWSDWHRNFLPFLSNFTDNFNLINEAAAANGKDTAESYWEMLSEFPAGYAELKQKWDYIIPLHRKITKYVKGRLLQKYELKNDAIPAHLLGTLEGYDWTNLASEIIPPSNIMFKLKNNLWEKNLQGRSLYTSAAALSSALLKQGPLAEFWEGSDFKASCPPRLFSYCRDGMMRVSTCAEASVANFLTAHKNVAKVALRQMTRNTPLLTEMNRYSALEDGLAQFFSIVSVSPAWLSSLNLLDSSEESDKIQMVSLMITALDVLPRIAYYVAADIWRLDSIRENVTDFDDAVSSWWRHRLEYETVTSSDQSLPSFLSDENVANNRPYLSKALGIILGFQMYEYVMGSTEVRQGNIDHHLINRNFGKMMKRNGEMPWPRLVKYIDIDSLSVDPLLSYFSPLEEYLEELEDEDLDVSALREEEVRFEKSEDKFRQMVNAPTTTTTSTTTTTTTTTSKPTTIARKSTTSATASTQKPGTATTNANANANSVQSVQADKPGNLETSKEKVIKINKYEELLKSYQEKEQNEQELQPKHETKKAIYAVGGVLLATILICVIAIFGKRRCTRVPKNRRFV